MRDRRARANRGPRYGWDAPGVMLGLLCTGGTAVGAGTALLVRRPRPFSTAVGTVVAIAGVAPLLIGAAKRLTRGGRAMGIDVWSAKDLSRNTEAATRRNIMIEGVADRTDVRTGNAVALSFPDQSFEIVLSLLCLHNIEPKSDQARACREIARVLKPGGRVVIGDYVPTHGYAEALRAAGLDVRRSSSAFGVAGALLWLLVADKPARQASL